MFKYLLASAALLAAGAAGAVTITSAPYDAPLGAGEKLVVTFDSAPAAGFEISGGTVRNGSGSGYAAPHGDTTDYLAVAGGQSATLNTPLLQSFSMYIGSVDSYNHITFKGANGYEETVSGADLVALANGDQSSAGTNRRFTFDFGKERVNQVIFHSDNDAFEFDNIAAGAVPEPATWAMLIAGFGLVGASMRRRKKNIVTA